MYFVTVTFSAQSSTVPSSIASTGEALRTGSTLPITLLAEMAEPTIADIDALVGPATPQFAYQLRARVRELVLDLPEDDPVRRYAEEQMELLDRLGHASTKAHEGGREPRSRPGWETLPSSAPVAER
jgi:hypothetical protein